MSLPRRSTRSGTRGYAHLVELEVPVARVWNALTDPKVIAEWVGAPADVDPRQGGWYRLGKRPGDGREAHIDIFDVNRRLRLIYLNGPDAPTPDSAVVDDFLLDVRKAGTTTLRVLGSGVPDAQAWDKAYARMRMTWERHLGRLKMVLETPPVVVKPPPPPVPKDPGLPGLDY
jgi:uncharacterized protein YndB with AHSA1/START domain